MKNIYEAFLRWLTLWLPEDSTMREHLTESSYESLDDEFWMAIAHGDPKDPRLDRLREELVRVHILGIISRSKVVARRSVIKAHLVHC